MRSLVGLALRARRLALGRRACRDAAAAGRLHLVLVASDAGAADGGGKIPRLLLGVDQDELGGWVNRERVAVLGILDPHMAAGLMAAARPPAAG